MVTTVGKLLFNRIMPKDFAYINEPTDANIQNGVDDRFFLEPGQDIMNTLKMHH
jgi:DNA-directed RNA polymerase subunit beta'